MRYNIALILINMNDELNVYTKDIFIKERVD